MAFGSLNQVISGNQGGTENPGSTGNQGSTGGSLGLSVSAAFNRGNTLHRHQLRKAGMRGWSDPTRSQERWAELVDQQMHKIHIFANLIPATPQLSATQGAQERAMRPPCCGRKHQILAAADCGHSGVKRRMRPSPLQPSNKNTAFYQRIDRKSSPPDAICLSPQDARSAAHHSPTTCGTGSGQP